MKIPVNRTFSPYIENIESQDEDYEDWLVKVKGESNKGKVSWRNICEKHIAVIVGEAGSGKTFEFRAQSERMRAERQYAFFLSLNQLLNVDQTKLELAADSPHYQKWLESNQPGYFFLDAVDEARLITATFLHTALRSVIDVLRPNLDRVRIIISSRITDWNIVSVKETVYRTLLQPIREAYSVAQAQICPTENALLAPISETTSASLAKESAEISLDVFSLDPLSKMDAMKFAEAYGAKPVTSFWAEIEDGNYEFMASRPLDLKWMAERWISERNIGGYAELIESAVINRLTEFNSSYIDSGAVLSADRLREGAEDIAAGCVFSGRPLVLVPPATGLDNAITASDVLRGWKPNEILRLLSTAVFDEATYGQVRFHHRAVREYLAASWVNRKIVEGLPLQRALSLFIRTQYGKTVLLTSRRATVCWLATLNARVREEIIRQFPEMLMFEGDPLRWSTDDVVQAFHGYIKRLKDGYRPDWWNDASELRRVAKKLPPEVLSDSLTQYSQTPEILYRLLALCKYGRVTSCANVVFNIYKAKITTSQVRCNALDTLSVVGTESNRKAVASDLTKGKHKGNELISEALCVVGLRGLTVRQLTKILDRTEPESEFGGGPMATATTHDLLPELDLKMLHKLIASILAVLFKINIEELSHRAESRKMKEAWMLHVLPTLILRALEMNSDGFADIPQEILDAALLLEKLRFTIYYTDDNFGAIRTEIEKHPQFRRRLAVELERSSDRRDLVTRMTLLPGMICFRLTDLEWLIRESIRGDVDSREKQLWYEIAREIVFTQTSGRRRKYLLASLTHGADKKARTSDIETVAAQWREGQQKRRMYTRMEKSRQEKKCKELKNNKEALRRGIKKISDGSGKKYIQWLIIYAAKFKQGTEYTKVNFEPIIRDFGDTIAEALSKGLKSIWRNEPAPNPADYPENQVPWSGIMGLAGINHEFSLDLNVNDLTEFEVTNIAQLTIWEFGNYEPWLEGIAETRLDTVTVALMPWFEHDLIKTKVDSSIPRVIRRIFEYPHPLRAPFLKRALELLQQDKIPNEELQRRLLLTAFELNIVDDALIIKYVTRHLKAFSITSPLNVASDWLGLWMAVDPASACSWIEKKNSDNTDSGTALSRLVAEALEHAKWMNSSTGIAAKVNALVWIYKFLLNHSSTPEPDFEAPDGLLSVQHIRDSIPNILTAIRGENAHIALENLAREHDDPMRHGWLQGFVTRHASAEADILSVVLPADLFPFGDIYCRDPQTELELFEQVLARLIDIREGVERGPFSDRVLFSPGMDEKNVQLWLAARLSDTPQRRFTARFVVHREPQVDDDNRTDIEVSSHVGKVCIEIKPVDNKRGYSATSLTGTIRDQLVGQYLRGQNSRHGILVLFRLHKKRWRIPGKSKLGTFWDLVDYLKEQAVSIKAEAGVDMVMVIGIDCVGTS